MESKLRLMNKKSFLTLAITFFVLATSVAHRSDGRAASPRATPSLAERMRQYTIAFGAGENAMRDFLTLNIAPEALTKRGVDERMKGYGKLRDQFGTLKVSTILSSKPGEIEAVLIARDGSEHEFIFTGQQKAPFKLFSIGYRQKQHH